MDELNNLWIKDIMLQKFIESDYTRIIMLSYFCSQNLMNKVICKKNVLEYIYRVYSDYPEIAKKSNYLKINKINRYGLIDIAFVLEKALSDWDFYQEHNSLTYDDIYIYLNITESQEVLSITKNVVNMLKKKYCNVFFGEPKEIKLLDFENDNLEISRQGIFRNRVFEDIQYCPLCEEIVTENLYSVHIIPKTLCSNDELCDKSNGLVMCKTHMNDYVMGKFYFDERGFVKNISSNVVNEKMHLGLAVRNDCRGYYLKENMKRRK